VSLSLIQFPAFIWKSEPPADCPFEPSKDIKGVRFLGRCSEYDVADTWYPSWADDDRLYSPFTDGSCPRLDGSRDHSWSGPNDQAVTGHAVLEGGDPLNLKIYSLGLHKASALPYRGRYPCCYWLYSSTAPSPIFSAA